MTRLFALVLVTGSMLAVAGCGDDGDPSSGESPSAGSDVSIEGFEFQPQMISVSPGTEVTWTNQDSASHTVEDKSSLGLAESSDLAQGDTLSTTYEDPGEYPYICGIHNYMTGTVVVEG